eukprot:sb/3469085/
MTKKVGPKKARPALKSGIDLAFFGLGPPPITFRWEQLFSSLSQCSVGNEITPLLLLLYVIKGVTSDLSLRLLQPGHKTIPHITAQPNLSWVKLLGYLDTLKRDLNTQGYSGQCANPGLASRVSKLHGFIAGNMPGWKKECRIPTISRNISYLTVGRSGTPSSVSSKESGGGVVGGDSIADASPEHCIVLQAHTPRLANHSMVNVSSPPSIKITCLGQTPGKSGFNELGGKANIALLDPP